ncbi:MAG: VWA domain-containing protein [Nannocystis sp.]|nr:VWA domain-containing protein [Nannocystis sp.]MBA3545415.1 VWA domain-containing protein [Nannocystis sp.]
MNAPSVMKWILLAMPLMVSGCRSASNVTPIGGTVEPGGGQSGGQGALLVQSGYEAPPHLFSPRPHPSHLRSDAPAANLAGLPKLVNRIDRCYGGREPSIAQPSPRPRPVKAKSNGGYQGKYKKVQYGGTSTGGSALGTVGLIGKGGGSGTGQGYGSGSGRLGGNSGPVASKSSSSKSSAPRPESKPMEPMAPAPRSPPPTSAPGGGGGMDMAPAADAGPADMNKRASRQEERQAKREAKKDARRVQVESSQIVMSGASPPAEEANIAARDDADDEMRAPMQPTQAVQLDDPRDQYKDWGQAIYLSNDDTMSLSSAQRVIFAIDKFLPLPIEHIRPHELLNYFSFETAPVAATDDFSVLADIAPDPKTAGIYNLALAIKGRPVDMQSRRNANLTFVVDRSGSMSDEGRMSYLKRGMTQMMGQLKQGDLVNVVLFDHEECTPIENFVVGRDNPEILKKAIDKMQPRGSTDVNLGLTKGYELADRGFQQTYNNRVVLVTDALANTGTTDPRTMAMVGKYYDSRKIRLSGVGVGREFNDALLDKLTERGRGAYVFLGSEAEVDAVFGSRFISLLETTAMDVHFQLHLPPSLRMNVFYGEESSVVKEDVQSIHYFANTSQLFLSDLMARGGKLRPQDQIMLTIEYEDPETGTEMIEERAFTLGEIGQEDAFNVRKGRLLIGWADRLAQLATRPMPAGRGLMAGTWEDPDGWQACDTGRTELGALAQGMTDPESARVLSLWDKFCSRYERPRNPVRRDPVAAPAAWPGASG